MIEENLGNVESPAWVARLSIPQLLQKIVENEPYILEELVSARLNAESDARKGYVSSIRHGSVYQHSSLLMNEDTRDKTFALLFHSDDIDSSANVIGSRGGRTTLIGSMAISNAHSSRLCKTRHFWNFLVASKAATKQFSRAQIFAASLREIEECKRGICSFFIYNCYLCTYM